MRTFLSRRLEGFGSGQNPGRRRQVGAADLAVIPRAVQALVMAQHERGHPLALMAEGSQRPLAIIGVQLRRIALAHR